MTVLTSCGITAIPAPEDITTDGLLDLLDGQSLDSLGLFAASDTTSIASLSCCQAFTDYNYGRSSEPKARGSTGLSAQQAYQEAEATLIS